MKHAEKEEQRNDAPRRRLRAWLLVDMTAKPWLDWTSVRISSAAPSFAASCWCACTFSCICAGDAARNGKRKAQWRRARANKSPGGPQQGEGSWATRAMEETRAWVVRMRQPWRRRVANVSGPPARNSARNSARTDRGLLRRELRHAAHDVPRRRAVRRRGGARLLFREAPHSGASRAQQVARRRVGRQERARAIAREEGEKQRGSGGHLAT